MVRVGEEKINVVMMRKRERVCVCVCVIERERERERVSMSVSVRDRFDDAHGVIKGDDSYDEQRKKVE